MLRETSLTLQCYPKHLFNLSTSRDDYAVDTYFVRRSGWARSEACAIKAAQRRFERRLDIGDWKMRADSFDVLMRSLR
jgi:hypothetical protein